MNKSTVPRVFIATGLEKSDVRHVTGLVAPDPFALVMAGRHLHLVVSALEAARARKTCPSATVHTPAELLGPAPAPRASLAVQLATLLHRLGHSSVEAGPWFPLGIARELERHGVEVRAATASPLPRRAIKTPREIAAITRSQHAAVAALRAALAEIRAASIASSGVLVSRGRTLTSERLRILIERTLLDRRCTAEGTIVAVGPQAARPHDEGSGPLRAHVPIVIDIFPRDKATGYWGDITRTFVRGRASPEVRRLHRTVVAAQKLALSMIRPGAESRAIQQAVEEFFRQSGYKTRLSPPGRESGFIHSVGHGIGLDIHESPGIRNEPGRLSAGHVLTVEPGLYVPGRGGVRIEDTVVVTPSRYKILATFPKKLET